MRSVHLFLCCFLLLSGCASPSATPAASQRLPTRVATPTPTITPFAISAQTYYEEGLARQRAGDAEGALQSFTWAIQRTPDFASAYVARGSVYLAQGDLDRALADADAALETAPQGQRPLRNDAPSGVAHALRGETLRLLDRPHPASEAFDQALELEPGLSEETFHSRWLVARALHDTSRMLALGSEHADTHPDDPVRHYYQGWAFIELGAPGVATSILVEGIETAPAPPALLWFALGQAYTTNHFWQEAVTAFEAARSLVQAGDISLALHSDRPIAALFSALGQAYLGAERCADAETTLEYAVSVGALASEYAVALAKARICRARTLAITPDPTTAPSLP